MKELCFAVLLSVDLVVQLDTTKTTNFCIPKGLGKNAIHVCTKNTTSGSIVAIDISEFTGNYCSCHLNYTGETDNHTVVEVDYRAANDSKSSRIKFFAYRNNTRIGLNETTKALTFSRFVNIVAEKTTPGTYGFRTGNACLAFKLQYMNIQDSLTLMCFNDTEPDLDSNTEGPTSRAIETKITQKTTLPQTTIRRTSTITTSPTTLTTTTPPQTSPGRISTFKSSPKTPTTTSLGSTAADRRSVSSPRGEQTSEVRVKNSTKTKLNVFSVDTKEEEGESTPAVQTGTITIIIILAVVAVVCTVSVVMVLYCLKRRKTHAFQRPVEQSTQQNEEDYEITENAMYVAYNSINTRNGDCEQIYEEADIENNQTGKEALSLLHDNEISVKDVDHRDKTLR